jgi:tetratricopeptide (TPR) repeat protein
VSREPEPALARGKAPGLACRRALAPGLVLGLVLVVGGAASATPAASQPARSGSSTGPRDRAAAGDPVREAFAAATAPGLADTTRVRLADFLARYGRHPLARDAHHELGLLAYARADYATAREQFRRARPPSGGEEARYWEGLSSFALGRPRDARALALPLARARRDTPRRWDASYLVALSWAQEGRRPEALAAYRELFSLAPRGGEAAALYQAIRLARELGRGEEAAQWRARLLRTAPGSPEAASLRAEEKAGPAGAEGHADSTARDRGRARPAGR